MARNGAHKPKPSSSHPRAPSQWSQLLGLAVLVLAVACGVWYSVSERAEPAEQTRPAEPTKPSVASTRSRASARETQAFFAAVTVGNVEAVEAGIDRGVSPDATLPEGWTALQLAAQNGHSAVAEVLLTRGRYDRRDPRRLDRVTARRRRGVGGRGGGAPRARRVNERNQL